MVSNKLTGAALIVVAGLMGAAAYAQDSGMAEGGMPRGGAGPMFDFAAMDANKDGKVTKAEIEAFKAARFGEADTNKDGKLSVEEMIVARDAMIAKRKEDRMAQMIARFDKDGDGMISQAEMPTPPNADKMFDRLDTDKDGAISQAELDAAKQMMQERMGQHDGNGKGEGRGHGKHHRGGNEDRSRGHGEGGFWGFMDGNDAPDGQGN